MHSPQWSLTLGGPDTPHGREEDYQQLILLLSKPGCFHWSKWVISNRIQLFSSIFSFCNLIFGRPHNDISIHIFLQNIKHCLDIALTKHKLVTQYVLSLDHKQFYFFEDRDRFVHRLRLFIHSWCVCLCADSVTDIWEWLFNTGSESVRRILLGRNTACSFVVALQQPCKDILYFANARTELKLRCVIILYANQDTVA